jgi:hypothetical protein
MTLNRKVNYQTILLSVVIISLIAVICVCFCKKNEFKTKPLSKIINSSTWVGQSFFTVPDTETISDASYRGSVRISFMHNEASISTEFIYTYSYPDSTWNYSNDTWRYFLNTGGYQSILCKGKATYTCEGNDITIKIKWDSELAEKFGGNEWTGIYSENSGSMGLKNVFGDIVTFSSSYY